MPSWPVGLEKEVNSLFWGEGQREGFKLAGKGGGMEDEGSRPNTSLGEAAIHAHPLWFMIIQGPSLTNKVPSHSFQVVVDRKSLG